MSKSKKSLTKTKLALAIAVALGCSLMSVASAATYDMTSSEYTGGITLDSKTYPNKAQVGSSKVKPDVFSFRYDKNTGKIVGGDVNVTSDVMSKPVFASLEVKASDLPDYTTATVNKVLDGLLDKFVLTDSAKESAAYYYLKGYSQIKIVDDDGNVIRSAFIIVKNNADRDKYYFYNGSAGKYTNVLKNDNNPYYDISSSDRTTLSPTYDEVEIPANTLIFYGDNKDMQFTIQPDLSSESLKAAVQGADKDLYVTNSVTNVKTKKPINGYTVLNINAIGNADDTVYGIYNDKSGIVSVQSRFFNMNVSGNDKGSAIYAGNNGTTESKVKVKVAAMPTDSIKNTITATGNIAEAGKNGVVEFSAENNTIISSTGGNIFYAHDGGKINVLKGDKNYLGIGVKSVADGKYLALAENKGEINYGVSSTHYDKLDYDAISVASSKGDLAGDMKTDADSKITFGISGTGRAYTGNVAGNIALYAYDGATWNGAISGDDSNINLGFTGNSVWNITSDAKQHVNKLTSSDAASKRNFVNVGAGDITIDKYAGNTTFVFQHTAENPADLTGGNVTIKSAVPSDILSTGIGDGSEKEDVLGHAASTVYLQTAADGINTEDTGLVNQVLDNLAKKLTYSAYVDGERNLSGRVEIAEGLTSSSVAKYYSNITFNEKTGQAQKEEKIFNPYVGVMFGDEKADSAAGYKDVISGTAAGKDLKYTFNDNAMVEVKLNSMPKGVWGNTLYCAAINNYGTAPYKSSAFTAKGGPSYTIDMQGHNLSVVFNAFPQPGSTGSQPMWTAAAIGAYREGTITIDNPGAVYLESRNNYYYGSAIRASTAAATDTGAHVIINNDNSRDHAVTIRGGISTPAYELDWRALEATSMFNDATKENSNTIDIKGLVDIETEKSAAIFARQGYSKVSVGGGRIFADKHESIWTSGENTMVNVNVLEDENGNVTGAGNNYVQITGDVRTSTDFYGEGGTINIGLTTPDSYLHGHFYGPRDENTKFNNNLWLSNGATWDNKGLIFHPWSGPEYTTSHESVISRLYGGNTAETAGNIYQNEAKDINIQNLSGYVNAYLGHEIGEDGNANFDALGNIVVEKATKTDGKNACITLFTDRNGIDTSENNEVVNTLTALAKKLVYNEAINSPEVDTETETSAMDGSKPEINLDGKVGIAEGLTAGSVAIRLADLDFNKENGEGSLIAGSIHTPDAYVPIMYGSKETAMMKGAKSAMASTAMLWRAENNDLMKRMGDLRLSEGERGLWAKYYGGKYEMDSQNTDFNLKYNAYQLGYDADAGNGWTVGAAVSYNDGDATYGNGRGDLSAYSAGIYGTWKSEDGQYVDIIAKYSKLDNDYKVFNDSGHKLSGDYKTWGTSISAEYGKRFENDNGFYFDPSVELTLGRINGKDYNAHSDYLDSVGVKKDMQVEQDAFNTLVGRVGFRLGQKLDNASYFVKLAAAHEFSGDFDTTFRAVNEPEGRTGIDFGDTWYEAQIGGTAKLSKNSLIYADFERSFGGDVEEKWRVDAGLRFTF